MSIHIIRCLVLSFFLITSSFATEVNLYTDRQEALLRPALDLFEKKTSIKVNALFIKKGLLERIQAEGNQSLADVIIAVDIGRLDDFVNHGLMTKHNSTIIENSVPNKLQTPYWTAITKRVRALFVEKNNTKITRYNDITHNNYVHGICTRSAKHTYNIALIADMISRRGKEKTKQWLIGVKNNLARRPSGNDRAQIHGVINGQCKVAIANSYYYFQMLKNKTHQKSLEEKVRMIIPSDAHINITGVGLATHAPNRKNGIALMEFLVSKEGQEAFAKENKEFPIRNDVTLPSELSHFAEKIKNNSNLADIAHYRKKASYLIDEVAFDR